MSNQRTVLVGREEIRQAADRNVEPKNCLGWYRGNTSSRQKCRTKELSWLVERKYVNPTEMSTKELSLLVERKYVKPTEMSNQRTVLVGREKIRQSDRNVEPKNCLGW